MTRLLLLAVLCVAFFAAPAQASAYVHLAACQSSLRGGGGSDNDVAIFNRNHGTRFGYWGHAWRTSATNVYVYARIYGAGWVLGHCWSYDWGPDSLG